MAALNGWQISINTAQPIKKQKNTFLLYFIFFFFLVAAGQREGAGRSA
jgi:hypothetical protein